MNLQILSGACIVYKNNTLLLKQSMTSRHPNLWGPPGGHQEKRESLIEVAEREVREETNLKIKITGLVQSGIKTHSDGRISVVVLYFATPLNPGKIKLDKSENSEYKWVTLEEIKDNKFPLRDPLFKPILIKALTQKPESVDAFKIF